MLCCWIVPQCQPVVEPDRQTEAPTCCSTEPVTAPDALFTYGVAVQLLLVATQDMSLPGKTEAWKLPCAARLAPVVLDPARPQWPALTKPWVVPRVIGKPIEHRLLLSM